MACSPRDFLESPPARTNINTPIAPIAPITAKPIPPDGLKITGINPPATHAIWLFVSNFENMRPRLASGASRCTVDSNASFPIADAALTTAANAMPPRMRSYQAAKIPATAYAVSAPINICVSGIRRRITGPTKFAPSTARPDKPTARANHAVPAISWRSQNAR